MKPGWMFPCVLGLLAALLPAPALQKAMAQEQICPASDGLPDDPDHFTHTEAALARKQLGILAIGSGTMVAPIAGKDEGSFPYRMTDVLRAAHPGVKITLVVHGGHGLTANEMVDAMRAELRPGKFQLVIWQTGTVEAVRNTPPGDLYQTLMDGATLVQDAGADLVLVDPQYSRFLAANTNLDEYDGVLSQAAALPDIVLFPRLALMRSWAESGAIDLEHNEGKARAGMENALHACLGRSLAGLIERVSRPAPPPDMPGSGSAPAAPEPDGVAGSH